METHIKIDNLKCGGCEQTIKKNLLAVPGIKKATVLVDSSDVIITHNESMNINQVKEKLKHLGYPETGTTEGIQKITSNVKSYVSCAIGKLSSKEEEAV